jgi:hypothetical protein
VTEHVDDLLGRLDRAPLVRRLAGVGGTRQIRCLRRVRPRGLAADQSADLRRPP